MPETNPPDEPALSRIEKTKARRQNERIKLLSSLFHSIALTIFGLVALRLLLDPAAQPPPRATVALALIAALVAEGAAYYILGRMKAES